MPLKNEHYNRILREYDRKQLENRHILQEKQDAIYTAIPAMQELDNEIARNAVKATNSLPCFSKSSEYFLAIISFICDIFGCFVRYTSISDANGTPSKESSIALNAHLIEVVRHSMDANNSSSCLSLLVSLLH